MHWNDPDGLLHENMTITHEAAAPAGVASIAAKSAAAIIPVCFVIIFISSSYDALALTMLPSEPGSRRRVKAVGEHTANRFCGLALGVIFEAPPGIA
jgi:hypothetical protein